MTRADINAATSSPQHMSRMRFADLRDRFADRRVRGLWTRRDAGDRRSRFDRLLAATAH